MDFFMSDSMEAMMVCKTTITRPAIPRIT